MVSKTIFLSFFLLTLLCGMIWIASITIYRNQKLQNYAYVATTIFAFVDLYIGFRYMCYLEAGF